MPSAGANSRRKVAVALTLSALAVGGGAEGIASSVHPKMTIKVKRTVGKDTIKGRVKGKDPACERRRKVKLTIDKPNTNPSPVASVRTNRKGKWKFIPPPNRETDEYAAEGTRYADPGDYRAKVRKKRVGGVTCGAGKSSKVWIG
jgi:hypothetical protein